MNPEQNELQERPAFTFPCTNCGSNSAEYDSPSKLCAECRTKFVRFPIPLWIKGFGLGIALVLVLALTKLPGQLNLGIAFERGKAAVEERNFITAQDYLEDFTTQVPRSKEGQAYLMIASFYNRDFETFEKAWQKLAGEEVGDDGLYEQISSLTDLYDNHFSSDSFDVVLARYESDPLLVPDTAYENFLKGRVNEIYASISYASNLYYYSDQEARADSILKSILNIDEEYLPAYELLSTMKRDQDSLQLSLKYCNKALAINHQAIEAMCSKARTLLKLKRDEEALAVAKKAFQLNSMEDHIQATLALAYHYINKSKERDEMLQAALRTDTASDGYARYVQDIINGKEQYR